jgi:hypothetical protein
MMFAGSSFELFGDDSTAFIRFAGHDSGHKAKPRCWISTR